MNYLSIQNNINQNKNLIISTSSVIIMLITISFYGLFTSILTILGVIYPIYNILNTISNIIPISSKSLKKEEILNLTKWNLILINHFVFQFVGQLIFFFNIFYIQIAQVGILYLLYKFNDSVNNSFESTSDNVDSSETLNNNIIITDIILIINKTRITTINKYVNYFINIAKKIDFNSDLIEVFSNYIGTNTKTVFVEKKEEVVKETIEETETEEITKDNNQNVAVKEKSL